MKSFGDQDKKKKLSKKNYKLSKEQIIYQAINLHQQGNFKDAIKLVNSYLSSKDSDRFKDVPKVLIKQLWTFPHVV